MQNSGWGLSRAEQRENPLPHHAGQAALDAAQGVVAFLGCEHMLPGHVQFFIHKLFQAILLRAALN